MKNDVQIKVTCITNENKKDEFHFDYYDKEGIIVGTIAVDEIGRLGWEVWNDEYQGNILEAVSFIFGNKVTNSMENVMEAKNPDEMRWDRAQEYIEKRGYLVNYLQNPKFNEVFENGSMKK